MISYLYGMFVIADAEFSSAFVADVVSVKKFLKAVLHVLQSPNVSEEGTLINKAYQVSYTEFGCKMLTVRLEDIDFVIPATDRFLASIEKLDSSL